MDNPDWAQALIRLFKAIEALPITAVCCLDEAGLAHFPARIEVAG